VLRDADGAVPAARLEQAWSEVTQRERALASLIADGLVVETDDGTTADPVPVTWPETYEPPVLKKYDDMADLLLVDPIHDVAADKGWPHRPSDGP
jgi:hypothetical protein